ncbi:MAG: polyribonucleotide nucleotidyltransferase [Patescibacteria group bacterium]|nr:polyribonucleotide nucleotidyltransferase [Patescibacteria group bacterium]
MNKLEKISVSREIDGVKFEIGTGKVGLLTSGSAVIQAGDTIVMANVVVGNCDEERDYFPMSVDFEDKWYATGRISGSRFVKREGRPSELATLRSRMIDRPIRPMFPKGYMNELQLIVTPLSLDDTTGVDPVVLGINAASAALIMSEAPFEGPLGAVRVGEVDGKIKFNPTYDELTTSNLSILVVGTKDAITMVEAEMNELPEDKFVQVVGKAHEIIKESIALQEELLAKVEKKEKETKLLLPDEKTVADVKKFLSGKLGKAVRHEDKMARKQILADLEDEVMEHFTEGYEEKDLHESFDKAIKEEVRRAILEESERPDGRKMDEVRELTSEVGLLPRAHGSGLFSRGITQVLSVVTLGSPSKAQMIDSMDQNFEKYYMHHYNDAPYSYGETGRLGPGRRAIGHGFLAEKALLAVLPKHEDFPYTIRVVSEVMSCNGSSSMAAVCGSSLALMDAGVPVKKHVAGVAMGLVTEDGTLEGKYEILTDIQAAEDFAGDMDFKAAGTKDGLTAFQLDIKIKGLKTAFIAEVLDRSKKARNEIIDVMEKAIEAPKKELSKYAPRLITIMINPEKIRDVIGKGGEMINKITAETGVEINIEDNGEVVVAGVDGAGTDKAVEWIKALTEEPEIGKTYDGTVKKVMDFGAFVEFLPGQEGLVHVSEISDERVEDVAEVLTEGQEVRVKLFEIDKMGRKNLSIKRAK